MFTLPNLKYSFDALEPFIDAKTMEIHHGKHHQGYVDKLNKALENYPDLQNKSLEEILSDLDSVPEDIRTAVRNNAGGHYNHSLFWNIMTSQKESVDKMNSKDLLLPIIDESFESFEKFQEEFNKTAMNIFGSGWAWVVLDQNKGLKIISTPNQDCPLSLNMKPIMGLDIWEHAYYLHYQNRRAEYVDAWWNILDWEQVALNYKNSLV